MKIIKIICKRKVETNCYEALMNIGKEESRPELMSVLKLAEEQGGTIIPKNISEHLLGGRPETLGEQIIYRLVEIGVLESTSIDGEYRLTNLGNQTIESEKILIPERGVYKVWFSEDPLFPSGLVGIQYSNPPDLRQEVRKMNEAYKNGKEIDEKLINIENLKHIIVIGDDDLRSGTSIFIYQLGEKGYRRNKDDRDLNFVLNIAPDNKTQLTVGAENDRVSIPSTEIDFNELMSIIIDSYRGEWSDEFLDISDLDELDTVSRRGFTLKKVEMNEIELLSLDDEESYGI